MGWPWPGILIWFGQTNCLTPVCSIKKAGVRGEIKRVGHTLLLGPSNQILQDWEGICLTLAPTFTKKQALNPLGSSDAQSQYGRFLLFTPHLAQEGNFSLPCRGLLPPACPSPLPPTLAAFGGLPRHHPIPSAEPSNRVAGPLP